MNTQLIVVEEILVFLLFIAVSYLVYQHRKFKGEILKLHEKDIEKSMKIENALCAVKDIGSDVGHINQKIEQHLNNPVCCKEKMESSVQQEESPSEVIKLSSVEKQLKKMFRSKHRNENEVNFKVYHPSDKTSTFTNVDALRIIQRRLYAKEIYPTLTQLNDIIEQTGRAKDPTTIYLKVAYYKAKKSLYDKFRRG